MRHLALLQTSAFQADREFGISICTMLQSPDLQFWRRFSLSS